MATTASHSYLRALFINTTLTRSPKKSHTELLMRKSMAIMEASGVQVDYLRAVDHPIAFGIQPDMRGDGWSTDAWPEKFWPKILAAEILVIGTPIWLGEESSICRLIIERLYAHSAQTNDKGQYVPPVSRTVARGRAGSELHPQAQRSTVR